jgi:hypothetical protein
VSDDYVQESTSEDHGVEDFDHPAEVKLWKIHVPGPRVLSMPKLDHDFIANCLNLSDCEARVAAHHRNLFHSQFGRHIEQTIQLRDFLSQYIRSLKGRVDTLSKQIRDINELVKLESEGDGRLAWSRLDRLGAVGLVIFSAVLLGMGLNTLATYLMDSGFVIFVQHPGLAYLLSAVNIGLAVLLKVGAGWCRNDVAKNRYFLWLWVAGLVSGVFWLVSFAIIFPNIGAQDLDEILANIGQGHSPWDAVLDGIYVCSQLISEICISAALWVHLARMIREHGPAWTMTVNPEHEGYLGALSRRNDSLRGATEKRALMEGRLREFQALEAAYVSKANSELKGKQASREGKRYGLQHAATGLFRETSREE